MLLTVSTIGAIQQDPIRRIFKQASLDLRFADNKSLTDSVTGASLVTFIRSSNGTFVGSDGVLRSAVTNLLLWSEELDNASIWGMLGTVTANATTAPNGTVTADLITTNGASAQPSQGTTISSGATITGSCFLKPNGINGTEIVLLSSNNTTPYARATFNIATGVISVAVTTANGGTSAFANIQAFANGWYRCSVTVTYPAVTLAGIRINAAGATGGIYVWGAQLEQSATVGEYIPTTSTINSAPRFDHNPLTGESLGLLVEEQRTNLLLRSEEFSTTWVINEATITTNQIVAPNGTTTADLYTTSGSTGVEHYVTQVFTAASSTIYTASVYVKAGTSSAFGLQYRVGSAWVGGNVLSSFNLSTQVATIDSGTATASITPAGDGWFRCRITATSSVAGGSPQFRVSTADGEGTIYLWGAQLEAGAFPTSYIPTTTAAATRNADLASIGSSAFTSFYNQSEGTLFSNARTQQSAAGHVLVGFSTGSFASSAYLSKEPSNFLVAAPDAAPSSLSFQLSSVSSNVGLRAALAFTAGTGSASAVMNGGTVGTDASTGIPITMSQMAIGTAPWNIGTAMWNGHIARLTYWPSRLQGSTLQAITG